MHTETIVLNEKNNVRLTAFIQPVGGKFAYITRRPAVVVIPGGAYQYCSLRESDPVVMPYLQAGYDAFILEYSVGKNAVWPQPLSDYEQAMTYILDHADEWNIYPDRIAVIGFSAGGHLAGAAAAMSEHRPAAAILGYPVLNDFAKACEATAPSIIPYVDEKTCPCFIFASRADTSVPIQNSLDMMNALAKYGISFESHIYAYGPHGFSTADPSIQPIETPICARVPHWVPDSIGFLRELFGDFCADGMTVPRFSAHVNADYEEYLSADCSFGHLMKFPEAVKILEPLLTRMYESTPGFSPEMGFSGMFPFLENAKLRDLPYIADCPDFDAALRKIKNSAMDE